MRFHPERISFSPCSHEEIEKISCVEVTVPASFDEFGHSIQGGLHDLRMGPLDTSSNCKTCKLSLLCCPGHFGHIKLLRVVFNPMFFDQMFSMTKCCCFHCKRFRITDHDRRILHLKFCLLKSGEDLHLLDTLYEIESEAALVSVVNRKIKMLKNSRVIISMDEHQRAVAEFFSSVSGKSRCVKCNNQNPRLIKGTNFKIFKGTEKDPSFKDESLELLSPEVLQEFLCTLFMNEIDLLNQMFPGIDYKMFFTSCILVTPNKFRPVSVVNGKKHESSEDFHLIRIIKSNLLLASDLTYWSELQASVGFAFDSSKMKVGKMETPPGHKQILEKKEGLFRRNIMGKRVNFAARSVISPDPYLSTREIGIPLVFAKTLTFPEKVTNFNADYLRTAVINGSEYPGSLYVQDGASITSLCHIPEEKRYALANKLLDGRKVVWRHLVDGDVVLVNRQPTLHKSSIMAHTCRVLKKEQTLRMHYANCKAYNADFDGDEMNIHFPQSYIAASEAKHISMNDYHYLIPTNGAPIRGLVQDHISAASVLTMKDSFFGKDLYLALVNAGLSDRRLVLERPCILRPVELYSGKQVISTVMKNLCLTVNMSMKTKIGEKMWGEHKEEDAVIFIDGNFITGVLDKNLLGATTGCLIHSCCEIYGFEVSNDLLTNIGRVINRYLLTYGFTVGLEDFTLNDEANLEMKKVSDAGRIFSRELQKKHVSGNHEFYLDSKLVLSIDSVMREEMNRVTSRMMEVAVPFGLLKRFPKNNMELMVLTGAKGSIVNLNQISGVLGQQELEGRRVPIMLSGKTLPCFSRLEPDPCAGGYIFQRFLTGIGPSQYFFHCMAGREGLTDTAVKTASSGYLQRCLVKHMEGVKVEYDKSVRIGKKIIQFIYGGDGLDCTKSRYLNDLYFYQNNFKLFRSVRSESVFTGTYDFEKHVPFDFKRKTNMLEDDLKTFMRRRYVESLVDPGEPVGIIAGQSIGEPSTQMTLNTFHLAGVYGRNVTLGIPRLKEILMTVSRNIKTPLTTIPIRGDVSVDIASCMRRMTLKNCITKFEVEEEIVLREDNSFKKRILITFELNEFAGLARQVLNKIFVKEFNRRIKKLCGENAKHIVGLFVESKISDRNSHEKSSTECTDEEVCEHEESLAEVSCHTEENGEEDKNDGLVRVYYDGDISGDHSDFVKSRKNAENIVSLEFLCPPDFNEMTLPLVNSILQTIVVRELKGIKKATMSNGKLIVEGSNFCSLTEVIEITPGVYLDLLEILDIYNLQSNDIYEIYHTFGVEAARENIISELIAGFDVYGISIDVRHLSLIADYMTKDGFCAPFNRYGLWGSDSPLQKMCFESCYSYLKTATLFCAEDMLSNPSASLTVGEPIKCGTACFDLLYNLSLHGET